MQDSIKEMSSGIPTDQLTLFHADKGQLRIRIRLRDICQTKSHYNEVKASVAGLAGMIIKFPTQAAFRASEVT